MRDAELAEGIIRGTIDFKVFWDQYRDRVYRWLYPMVRNAEDARDLTDCVFVRAWQRLGRYDATKGSLCTWLYLTAKTVAYSFLRKHRQQAESLEQLPESRQPSCAGPEERHEAAEARARLWRAVAELPEPERAVLSAHFHDGYSWAEVAHKLGVSLRTVKFHSARGLALLNGKL
jgi:RNA polymerase sigma-70 factor (ECF subfamily)